MNLQQLTTLIRQAGFRSKLLSGLLGLVFGIILWNGFMLSLEASSTTEFCISCHSMQAYIYPSYQQSIHYRNSKGIQAECSDCHVPKPLAAKLVRKTIALKDIYHTIIGSLDTPDKFAAQKQHLAERVRQRMRASDSRECRNCHQLEHMDLTRQTTIARKQHQEARQQQKTCVDCHQGVGHPAAPAGSDDLNSEENFSLGE